MTNAAYYQVCLHTENGDEIYTVCAVSDYAAACHVRAMTGRMAQSESDVTCLFAGNDFLLIGDSMSTGDPLSVCSGTHPLPSDVAYGWIRLCAGHGA